MSAANAYERDPGRELCGADCREWHGLPPPCLVLLLPAGIVLYAETVHEAAKVRKHMSRRRSRRDQQ